MTHNVIMGGGRKKKEKRQLQDADSLQISLKYLQEKQKGL
jgi:hypothetical protein